MPSAFVAPERARVLVLALGTAWVVGLAVFVAATVLVGRETRSELLDTWLYSALALGAAALAVLRVAAVRRDRWLWALNGLALTVYAAGDILYSFWVVDQDPEPYPSVADVLWLAYYVLAVAFLVRLLRRRARDVSRSTAVDGVVVGLGAAAATAAVSFDTILTATDGGRPLETAATLGYPVGALVLLGTAGAALAVMGWRVGLQWWALVLGGLVFAGADTVYAYLTATDGYTDGGALDALWLVALGLQACAAWLRPRHGRHATPNTLATLVLPLAFAGAALGLLVLEHFQRLSLLALVLAAATVAAALLRISVTVEEVRQLAVTRVQALTDDLTGLPNRRRLDEALRTAVAGGGPVGLLMLDLDRFKDVNDALGHPVGDTLLVQVGRRLRAGADGQELVARLGGDEFAVVLPGVRGEALLERARAVAALLGPPVDLGHISLHVSTSVGAASFPDHAEDASRLMRAADVAMYRAKRRGSGVALYEVSADTATPEHLRVIEEFRATFAESGVHCSYRPVRDLRTGTLRRWSAEPHWSHPRLGDVPTRELLEMVERTGLVREHTTHVLARALADRAAAGPGGSLVVAVRLSAVELLDARLPGTVVTALERHGVEPDALLLECEESALAAEPERCTRALLAVHRVGVRIGLVGHGTGPTSLPHLRRLPLSGLAVDGALVAAVAHDGAARAVLKSAVVLGHELGVEVTASGVADVRLLPVLADLGVDAADGPAVGEPVDAAAAALGEHVPTQ